MPLNLDHHSAVFDLDWINSNPGIWIVNGLSGFGVILPAMPRADKFVTFDHSLPKRPTAVQADIVHSGDGAVHVGNADDSIADGEFLGFSFGREFGFGGQFGERHFCF